MTQPPKFWDGNLVINHDAGTSGRQRGKPRTQPQRSEAAMMGDTKVTGGAGEKAKELSHDIIDMIIGHDGVVAMSALTGALGMAIAHNTPTDEELVMRRQ